MKSKINLNSSVNFKMYLSLIALFVNAVISVFIVSNLYLKKTEFAKANYYKGAVIITDLGSIEIAFNKSAPAATENFITLAQSGFYNGLRVHRIVSNVLIETGDPLSRTDELKSKWGNGGPGYTFADEINSNDKMAKGVVAMVNNGPNTNGSQFFILADDAEWLNGQHTILARVVKGQSVVDRISSMPISVLGIPQNDIFIKEIVLK